MSVEAVMIWNEPNNASHWDLELDPDWSRFAEMARLAAAAIRAENPKLNIVLGGISPIDPGFITNLASRGVLDAIDTVAVHGFPLDWNHWQIDEWPDKLASIHALTDKPVWVTEVGASSFGAEEVQGVRAPAQRRDPARPRPARALVQPVRLAPRVASDDAAPRGGGLVVLSALLHGPAAGRWHTQARAAALLGLHAGARALPVATLRGSSPRRRRRLAEEAGRAPPAHRPVVGR